ncbi:hypothetical protein [Shimazuella kribbensis]|uniref:hypothetical protein n=1 Tax=Shimazuella kribbensis TaxID=139808 RepID=UPI0003F98C45|nr:hypothetical protein [Shimazuella kribbensis]
MNKKKETSSKWDMEWKKPKRQKLNWKIPKGWWIIVGLLLLFTGITLATNILPKKETPKKETPIEASPQKKQPPKKTNTSSTEKQTATIYSKPREDRAPKQQKPQNPQNTNPSPKPEVKTVYIYKDSPNDKTKTPSSKKSSPATKKKPNKESKPSNISRKNVVLNGGFEDGLNHWDSWSPDGQGVAHAATNDHPASGEKILAHWFDRDYRQLSYQIIYNLPNGTYRLTGKARSSGGQADLKLGVKDFDNTMNNEEKYVQLSGQAEPTKWKSFHVDDVVVKAGMAIVFTYSVAGGKQWAAFDDITFYRVK